MPNEKKSTRIAKRFVEMREEYAKMLYVNRELVGMAMKNGTLKMFKITEVTYGEIDKLFNGSIV